MVTAAWDSMENLCLPLESVPPETPRIVLAADVTSMQKGRRAIETIFLRVEIRTILSQLGGDTDCPFAPGSPHSLQPAYE
jgi:hypothetical protein